MYALNIIVLSNKDLTNLKEKNNKYRAIYTDNVEDAIARMQSINLDMLIIDKSTAEADKAMISKILQFQQADAEIIEIDIVDEKELEKDIIERVQKIQDTMSKNSIVFQETSI